MKSKASRAIIAVSVFVFWVAVWWLLSLIVDNSYLLPSPVDTFAALFSLLRQASFYKVVFLSFCRVVAALVLGVTVGTLFAFLCHKLPPARELISPIISIIKAMPVATFILLLWLTLRGSSLTVFIGFIMVMPIVYQNVLTGLDSIDKDLREVAAVFEFDTAKKLRLLVFPAILPYFAAALITSVGLTFKSQIAAEIIAYTKNSIGQHIYDANFGLNTNVVFAWATVIVIFSISLEKLTKYLLKRVKI